MQRQEEASLKIVQAFEEKETMSGSITSTLEGYGWRKNEAGDAGYLDSLLLEDNTRGIPAVLEVEGVSVGGFGFEEIARLGRLYFIDRARQPSGWLQSPKDERDASRVALKDLSPVFYSEVIYNIRCIRLKDRTTELV